MLHVLRKAIEDTTAIHIPHLLEEKGLTIDANVGLAKVCNGAVDPLMNETMTNYSMVINLPALCATCWLKAICKELGNIAQGYSDGD